MPYPVAASRGHGGAFPVLPYTFDPSTWPDGAMPGNWLGSGVYAVTTGKIANTPTIGPTELVQAPDFSASTNWNCGAGWSIGGGIATALTAATLLQHPVAIISLNKFYKGQFDLLTRTAGNLLFVFGSNGYHGSLYRSSPATYYSTGLSGTAGDGYLYIMGGSAFSGTIDNVSVKEPNQATCNKYIDCQTPLVDVAADWTIASGTASGVVSSVDATGANGVYAWHDGANQVVMAKLVAGAWTPLLAVTVAYAAGAAVRIKRTANTTFQLFYNGTQRGVDQTVSDAGITANNNFGLFSTHAPNTCSAVRFLAL